MSNVKVNKGRAVKYQDHLLVEITGEKPSPAHVVSLIQRKDEPNAFDIGSVATGIIVPKLTAFVQPFLFAADGVGGRVDVYHQGGRFPIDVTRAGSPAAASGSPAATDSVSAAIPTVPRVSRGYADAFDVSAALVDAIQKLPKDTQLYPDKLTEITVRKWGALLGGFVGYTSTVFVEIEAK